MWQLGPYQLRRELGVGATGTVYLATGPNGDPVALKLVHSHLLEGDAAGKWEHEARAGARVDHGNVVRVLDHGLVRTRDHVRAYIAMEYVKGRTLRSHLQQAGRIDVPRCNEIAENLASAIAAIHRVGLLHNDLKPENVVLDDDDQVKILDLGCAALTAQSLRDSVASDRFGGTVRYAAPERLRSNEDVDGRSDLYSLGLLLYELMTGCHPCAAEGARPFFSGRSAPPLSQVGVVAPPAFEEIVMKLLRRDRSERISSAEDLVRMLRRARWAPAPKKTTLSVGDALPGRGRAYDTLLAYVLDGRRATGALVEGGAGIGKTHLVSAVVNAAQTRGIRTLHGGYVPGERMSAWAPYVRAVASVLVHQDAHRALEQMELQALDLIPSFAALITGKPAPARAVRLTPETLELILLETIDYFSREHPLMLLVEDLHFGPASAYAAFAQVARRLRATGAAAVATTRSRPQDDLTADIHVQLEALDETAIGHLLEQQLGSERTAAKLSRFAHRHSGGVPFAAHALVDELRATGMLRRSAAGSLELVGEPAVAEVPGDLDQTIDRRLKRLDSRTSRALACAACVGFRFDITLIAAALHEDPKELTARLQEFAAAGDLVRERGSTFEFSHHLILEALRGRMADADRRELHGALASELASRAAEIEEGRSWLPDWCEHALASGAVFPSLERRVIEAIDGLSQTCQFERAVRLGLSAARSPSQLSVGGRIRILLNTAVCADRLGLADLRETNVNAAADLAEGCGDPALRSRAALSLAAVRGANRENLSESLALRSEALGFAREAGDVHMEVRARVAHSASSARCGLGTARATRASFELAASMARRNGDRVGEMEAWRQLGLWLSESGRVRHAIRPLERAYAIARRGAVRTDHVRCIGELAWALYNAGEVARAIAISEKGIRLARRIGYVDALPRYEHLLSVMHLSLGDFGSARRAMERYRVSVEDRGAPHLRVHAQLLRGQLMIAEGRSGEAMRVVGERYDEFVARRDWLAAARAAYIALHACAAVGHDVQRWSKAAIACAKRTRNPVLHAYGLVGRTRGESDEDVGRENIERAVRLTNGLPFGIAARVDALLARASLEKRVGDLFEARRSLRRAVRAARSSELRHRATQPLALLAAWGDVDAHRVERGIRDGLPRLSVTEQLFVTYHMGLALESQTWLREARAHLRHVVAHAPFESRRGLIDRVPLYRAVHATARG